MSDNFGNVELSSGGLGENIQTYEVSRTVPNHTLSTVAVGLLPGALSSIYLHSVLEENSGYIKPLIQEHPELTCVSIEEPNGEHVCAVDYYDEGIMGTSLIAGLLVANFASGVGANLMGNRTTTVKEHSYKRVDLGSAFKKAFDILSKPFKSKINNSEQQYKVGFDLTPKN